MKILRNALVSLLMLSTLSTAGTFEQNGVKEGNDRVSITLLTAMDDDEKLNVTFEGRYGRFITDDIELLLTANSYMRESLNNLKLSTIGVGGNYYFAKTPTLTPYIGATAYYYIFGVDVTDETTKETKYVDDSLNGGEAHIGLHYFLTENMSVTPVIGSQFVDFTDYTQSYANIYLTYFF
jgi:hypothetical protein